METISLPRGHVLVRAFYGDAKRQSGKDVTEKVRALIAGGKDVFARNSCFGDPLPGVTKVLFVDSARHEEETEMLSSATEMLSSVTLADDESSFGSNADFQLVEYSNDNYPELLALAEKLTFEA
jgi:hypothetical protein